jgi:streptogramin lyase
MERNRRRKLAVLVCVLGTTALATAATPAAAKKGDLIVSGFQDNALYRVNPKTGDVSDIHSGPPTNNVSYVTLEPNGSAVITDENGGGVWRIDLQDGSIDEVAPGEFDAPYGIDRAPSGDLHVADYGSGLLSRIDRKTEDLSTIGPNDGSLADFSYGIDVLTNSSTLLANTDSPDGVVKVTREGGVSTLISHPDLTSAQDVARVANGDIYVLDDSGDLFRYKRKTGTTSLVVPEAVDGSAYSIAPAPNGSIYVSDFSGLINRVNPKTGDIDQVLPDTEINTIVGMELEPPECKGKLATIVGSNKNDKLKGSKFADVIVGLKGNDKIKGGKGKDRICGGKGKDKLSGQGGKDKLDGGPGKDKEVQ